MELNTLTQTNNRLTADAATPERTSAALKAEVLQLQAQAARAESIDRELHQAKWRVSQLEGEVRDTSGDLTYRLTQAQSQLNQAHQQAAQYQQQASQLQAQLVHTQQQLGQAQQQLRSLSSMQNSTAAYAPPPMPAPAPYIVPTYIPPPAPAPIPASLPRSGSTGRLSSNRPLMVDANPAHGRSASGGAFPAYDPNSYQSSYPSAAPSISLAAHASSNP
jgi:multidrug efflux pump subunit AcrA (membrane-fusion protein)